MGRSILRFSSNLKTIASESTLLIILDDDDEDDDDESIIIKGDEGVNSDDAGINDELFLYTDHDIADYLHISIMIKADH
jgi:hypothetical protein